MHTAKPYGAAIQEAISSGDVNRMREAQRAAEEHLKDADEIRAALEQLREHIRKAGHPS